MDLSMSGAGSDTLWVQSCMTDGEELLRVIYETDSDITHCTA